MEFTPFTHEQASEICEDFVDLIDTEFTIGAPTVFLVNDLLVTPFQEEERLAFIDNYYWAKANNHPIPNYSGNECDVVIFACNADDETELTYITMRAFIKEKGIHYNFPEDQDHGHH